jgi:hypothetical protein
MDIGGITMEKEIKILRWLWEEDPDPKLEVDPEEDPEKGEPTFTKADIEKAAARRQAALKRAREAEDKYKALKDKVTEMPDPDEFDSLRSDYQKLQDQLKELSEKQDDEDLKKIEDEKERARVKMEREFEKERSLLKKQMEDMNKQIDSFSHEKKQHVETLNKWRRSSLENDIISTAAPKAYNPKQIVKLIVDDFEYDEQDDRWYKHVYDEKGKLTTVLSVKEFVTAFLADEDNENLLKADIKRGSDTPRGNQQQRQDDGPPVEKTPTDEMFRWAEMSGLEVNKKSSAEDQTWLFNTYQRLHGKKID